MPEDNKNKNQQQLQLKLVVDEEDLKSKGTLDKTGHSIVLNQGDTSASFTIEVDNAALIAFDKEMNKMYEDITNTGKKLNQDFIKLNAKETEVTKLYSVFEKTGKFTEVQSDHYKNIAEDYKKQRQQYEQNYEKYKAKKKAYQAKKEERKKIVAAQDEKLKNVRWIWNVTKGKPEFTKEQYRKDFGEGIKSHGAKLPKVLEGGGMGWIEGFLAEEGPKNEAPNGYYISAKGTPKILATRWRVYNQQNNGKIINGETKKFKEAVQLHVYTQALYGQDLNIELYDTKYENASLPPYQLSEADREKMNKDKATPKSLAKYFQREVKLYPIVDDEKAFVDKIISNYLGSQSAVNGTAVVQKAVIDVYLDEVWRYDAGNILKVHAIVNPVKKDAEEYQNEDEYIAVEKVSTEAMPLLNGNTPVIQGDIEVNASNFKPCKYTGIELNKEAVEGGIFAESDKKVIVYREDSSVSPQPQVIKTGMIFGSSVRTYNITLQELVTNAHVCLLSDSEKHPGKTFKITSQPETVTNIKTTDAVLKFDAKATASFVKLNYLWPTSPMKGDIQVFKLKTSTCRHSHSLEIGLYPDIGWSFKLYYTPKYAFTNIQDISNLRPHAVTEAYTNYRNSQENDTAAGLGEQMKVKLGFKFECTYDGGTEEITKDFIDKIWKTMNLFRRLSTYVNDLCESSGTGPNSIGVSFKIKQTEIAFVADWKASEKKDKNGIQQVGVDVSVGVETKPLIGASITIDLLKAIATGANPGVGRVISALKDFEYKGNDENYIRSQLSFDLILSGDINLSGTVKFNTIEDKYSGSVNGNTSISVKVYLGYKLSGKVTFVVSGEVEGEASVSGEASVTGGIEIGGEGGFYILPIAKFNGLLVKFVFKGSIKGGWYSKGFDLSPKEPITILPPYPKSGESFFNKIYPFK